MFWAGILLLCVAAGGFVLAPFLWRSGARKQTLPDATSLYRARLQALSDESDLSELDGASRTELRDELGRALLDDLAAVETATPKSRPQDGACGRASVRVGLSVALVVAATAVLLYWRLGEQDAARLSRATDILALEPARDAAELSRWHAFLEARAAEEPENTGVWLLLGHLQMKQADYAQAATAFERAHVLAGEAAGLDVYWLQARFLAADGALDDSSRALANDILERQPGHATTLELLGLDAYRRGDHRAAVMRFNRALTRPLPQERQILLWASLIQARQALGDLLPAIDVQVRASAEPPAGATLFVLARPPGGGMPYALARRPAILLPRTIRLDETTRMSEALSLADADTVEVLARISLSGTATPHPGDWEWRSAPIRLKDLAAPLQLDAELTRPARQQGDDGGGALRAIQGQMPSNTSGTAGTPLP